MFRRYKSTTEKLASEMETGHRSQYEGRSIGAGTGLGKCKLASRLHGMQPILDVEEQCIMDRF